MIVRSNFAISFCLSATLSIGSMLAATDIVSAGTVSRDHRGPNGAPTGGGTVNGQKATATRTPQLGGPKWKGGYDKLGAPGEKGTKSGVTVRDHR